MFSIHLAPSYVAFDEVRHVPTHAELGWTLADLTELSEVAHVTKAFPSK